MKRLFDLIDRVAGMDASVLILGESGSGKELVAREIHERSSRRRGPFVPVNTAAIPGELLESEMFGHRKGAFTGAVSDRLGCFEMADGGTVFLDEIGDMPLGLQPKLLRTVQDRVIRRVGDTQGKRVDFRIVSATNTDLRKLVSEKQFREDLYFRLSVLPIALPPLRERLSDLPMLIDALLERLGLPCLRFDTDAERAMNDWPWPGNVRELENVLQRCALEAKDDRVTLQAMQWALHAERHATRRFDSNPSVSPASDNLLELVKTGEIRVGNLPEFTKTHGKESLRKVISWAVNNSPSHAIAMKRIGYSGSQAAFRQYLKRLRDDEK